MASKRCRVKATLLEERLQKLLQAAPVPKERISGKPGPYLPTIGHRRCLSCSARCQDRTRFSPLCFFTLSAAQRKGLSSLSIWLAKVNLIPQFRYRVSILINLKLIQRFGMKRRGGSFFQKGLTVINKAVLPFADPSKT